MSDIYVLVPVKVRMNDGKPERILETPNLEQVAFLLEEFPLDCVSAHTWEGSIELLDELVEGIE